MIYTRRGAHLSNAWRQRTSNRTQPAPEAVG